jgi:hypothetical protein
MSNTYQERVGRYRILKHEELPEAHKAEYRINGIDPDTLWTLVWSFDTLEAAEEMLKEEQGFAASWQTYKLVDGGQAEVIERVSWF